ncbi:YciI family protein [Rhodococcus qingshengii]|uniref:YciI family protein n=1 Tax=Rhodococcus qingshengii TaxID=334542 RepID=UPI0021B1301F|nr:YciI family protein [Rhodococcus qingshengii]MCT6736589.1 YciI family protein [Rhodococcus qingshengii]
MTYAYDKTKADARSNHRPAHNTWLADLVERNIVQCSGPFASGNGGLLIFRSDSIETLNALLLEDPFAQHNLIVNTSIEQWRPVHGTIGSPANP